MSQNPMETLKDVHIPPAIPIWPPSLGWWVMAGLLLIFCLSLFWFHQRTRKRRRLKYEALCHIKKLESSFLVHKDSAKTFRDLSGLTRRIVITLSSDSRVAGIQGKLWVNFLQHLTEGKSCTDGSLEYLHELPYRSHPKKDPHVLVDSLNSWVRALPLREKVLQFRINEWFNKTSSQKIL